MLGAPTRGGVCNGRQSGFSRPALLGLVVAVGAAGAMWFYMQKELATTRAELAAAREQMKQLQADAPDTKEVTKLRAQVREAESLRKEAEELPKLRGEVTQLRKDKAVFEQAKAENAQLREWAIRLQAENAAVRGQNQSLAQAAASPAATAQTEQTWKALCIENLKQIDGAIQQWALENKKQATDSVELKGILPYLRGSLLPLCPASGNYSPGSTVSAVPTCTVPGHTL